MKELYDKALLEYRPPRYRVTSNEPIPEVPTLKEKPDVAVYDLQEKKIVKIEEAARFGKRGGLVRPDEKGKIPHYEGHDIPYEFFPVGKNAPPTGTLKSPPPVTEPPATAATSK